MTLIAAAIGKPGIVHVSDSNLTAEDGSLAGEAKKVFRLGFAPAALAVAGAYSVGGVPMDQWMQSTIDTYGTNDRPTLQGLSEYLRKRLTEEITESERDDLTLVHIAGYVEQDGTSHPEFYFVRNFERLGSKGDYQGRLNVFELSEDFWTRDFKPRSARDDPNVDVTWRYFNGLPEGRIAYLGLVNLLPDFFNGVWNQPGWKFRPPRNAVELGAFMELEVRTIGTLFVSSDYAAPYIGGPVQIEAIDPPPNAVGL